MSTPVVPPTYDLEKYQTATTDIQIRTKEDYHRYGELLVEIATVIKKYCKGDPAKNWPGWDALILSAHQTHQNLLKGKKSQLMGWEVMRELIEKAMKNYQDAEVARNAKLQEEMQKTANAAKIKLEQQAKRESRKGNFDEADQLRKQIAIIPDAPQAPPPDFRLEGVSQPEEYEIEVTDLKALINAVASGDVPMAGLVKGQLYNILEPRISVIQYYVKQMGDAFNFPGVKVTKKTGFRPRATA